MFITENSAKREIEYIWNKLDHTLLFVEVKTMQYAITITIYSYW